MTEADNEKSQMASIRELVEKHKKKAAKAPRKRSGSDAKSNSGAAGTAEEESKKDVAAPVKEVIVDGGDQEDIKMLERDTTFADLGVCPEICEAVEKMGYTCPSKIQKESLPFTLKSRDIIGLAETGSGKTAAFAIPVIQALLENPQPYFACVMSPTRELCVQIAEQFEAIGALIGLRTAVLVGGLDMVSQAIALAKKPHVIVGTPGRMADHLANTKGFNMRRLKFLIFDEADRLLSMDFEKQINLILT